MKITIIGGSTEACSGCSKMFPPEVEIQAITTAPYFDDRIDKAIQRFRPSLIMLELLLQEDADSGFSVLRKLKDGASPLRDIPVVVCSKLIGRDPNDRYRSKAMEMGAAAALAKIPFPSLEILMRSAGLEGAGARAYGETKAYM